MVSSAQPSDYFDDTGPDWQKKNGIYFRYLTLSAKPTKVPNFWVGKLMDLPGVIGTSVHHGSLDDQDQLHQVNRLTARTRLKNALESCISLVKRAKNKILMRLSRDTETIKSSENSSNVSVYIEMAATSKEDLDWCTELVIKAAEEQGLNLTPIKHNHMEAKTSTGPLGMDPLNIKYNMSSKAAGSTSFVFLNSDDEEKEDDE